MHNLLVPALLLVVAPLAYFAVRAGWTENPRRLRAAGAAAVAVVAVTLPYGGIDYVYTKRISMLVAAATALWLLLRHLGAGAPARDGAYRAGLVALATLSAVTWLNFFDFHGERTFVHLHDVAHYYLGSKYHDELGYGGLYTAMLRAEAEVYDDRFKTVEARDLTDNRLVHIRTLLQRSGHVRERFTEARWRDFKLDVANLRDRLGPHYPTVLADHGYNPTPVWTAIGAPLASLVPAGSNAGLLALALLDPLLLVVTFAAIARTFGLDAAALSVTLFGVVYGANFGWVGGAFLRYPWLASLVCGLCALVRGRPATGGALVALSTSLRLFPAAFAFPLLVRALGPAARAERRFAAGWLAGIFVAVGLSVAAGPGADAWRGFTTNMAKHQGVVAPNLVGATKVLAYRSGPPLVTAEEFDAIAERQGRVYRAQLATLFVLVALAVAAGARRTGPFEAASMGALLCYAGLNLASYYYVFLVVVLLANRDRPGRGPGVLLS